MVAVTTIWGARSFSKQRNHCTWDDNVLAKTAEGASFSTIWNIAIEGAIEIKR